jgi:poly(3-hydroxybutyrate) depolymerase
MSSLAHALLAVLLLVGCGGSAPETISPPTPPPPTTTAQLPAGVEQRTIVFQQSTRTYYLYVPPDAANQPLPTLILHHGTGGTGLELINAWRNMAANEHIILVAPKGEHGFGWMVPDDGPEMQIQIIQQLTASVPIDMRRIYLFGYSNGGDFVLYAAIQQSKYFAAAAIHSAAFRPRQFPMLDIAERKIPLWYSAGTEDPTFTIQECRATVDALRARNWPLDYVERAGQGHAYIAGDSNPLIWAFLRDKSLASDPVPTPLSQQWLSFALR